MKVIAASIVVVFSCRLSIAQSEITHQRLFDTIPYIPEHHEKRLAVFAKEPMDTGGIIFLGNSITEGGEWSDLLGQPIANRGIGGDISFGLLKRLNEIVMRQPDKLFLMIGVNDIGKDIPAGAIANNVGKLISRMKKDSPGTRIYIQSILPVNPEYSGFPQHYNKQNEILMTNQLLFKAANDNEVTFINLFPFFLDSRQRLKEELTYDGLHLNDKGYELWAHLLKEMDYF